MFGWDTKKIKNSIAYKIWDYSVLFLVVVSIGFLIHSYFEITPEQQENMLIVNTWIAGIFLVDVIVRIILFGKKYILSTEIIIDALACSDIITPALRAARGVKYTRFVRILRILRMLRIFRGIKAVKHSSQCAIEEKLFNTTAIFLILGMIVISIITADFIDKRLKNYIDDNYKQILRSFVITSKDENGNFNTDSFIEKLKMLDDVIYYKIALNDNETPIENYISITEAELEHKYFHDDIHLISLNDRIFIRIIVKQIKFYVRIIEFIILISALPLLILLLIFQHLIILKYYSAPVNAIKNALDLSEEFKKIELNNELAETDIYELQTKYNTMIDNYNTRLWEYYSAYEELRKKAGDAE